MVQFYRPQKPKKRNPKVTKLKVTIERLDGLGNGIAFFENKPIFIANALPTEEVEIQITEDKKNYSKGKVLNWITQSSKRIAPLCSHYLKCGGCQLQHLTLDKQHEIKRSHFNAQFNQTCHLDLTDQKIEWISDEPFHYRRRVRIALYQTKKNEPLQFGLREDGQKNIVNLTTCPILMPELEALLSPLKTALMQLKHTEKLGHLDLLAVESGLTAILRITAPLINQDQLILKNAAEELNLNFYLHEKELTLLQGKPALFYQINQLTLAFSPFDFIQVNAKVNQLMINAVLNSIDFKGLKVLDLFCGMGNFSFPIATRAKKVVGVEVIEDLVNMARQNIIQNKALLTAKMAFYQADLTQLTGNESWLTEEYDLILLDPARDGALYLSEHLIKKRTKHIIYISCNLATLARDCALFLKANYTIKHINLIDMFPQTKHNESMLILTYAN